MSCDFKIVNALWLYSYCVSEGPQTYDLTFIVIKIIVNVSLNYPNSSQEMQYNDISLISFLSIFNLRGIHSLTDNFFQ